MKFIICLLIANIVLCIDPVTTTAAISSTAATAKEVAELFKTEFSQTMSDITPTEGFKTIDNRLSYTSGTISASTTNLDRLFQITTENAVFKTLNPFIKEQISRAFVELGMQIITRKGSKVHEFIIQYNGNDGVLYLFHISLKRSQELPNAIDYEKFILSSVFKPGDSYVIITESDSNILSSSTTQRIQWIPSNLKDAHIGSILRFNSAILDGLYIDNTPQLDQE